MRVVCYEIGTFSIKVLEADVKSKNVEIVSFRAKEVKSVEEGGIRKAIFQSLKEFVEEYRFKGDKTIVVIPGYWVTNKTLVLPFKDKKRIKIRY